MVPRRHTDVIQFCRPQPVLLPDAPGNGHVGVLQRLDLERPETGRLRLG